jgi:hypothetical protein
MPLVVAVLGAAVFIASASEPSPVPAQQETGGASDDGDRMDPRNSGVPRHPGEKPASTSTLRTPSADALLCLPAWGTFGPGNWPSGCWRPYSSTSPFNQPIPPHPRLDPRSSEIVSRLLSFGQIQHLLAGEADTPDDYGHPTYYSQLLDPLYTLHCYESSWGTCPIEGKVVSVSSAARPATGGDGHMTIVDQIAGVEYDLYKVRSKPSGGGTLEFRWGGSTSIDGLGLGSAATASKFGNLAGIIRAQELEAGEINHAIFMVAKCDSGEYVYPAGKVGRQCSDIGLSNADAPPMGARFQLDMSDAEIDALAVPAWKKTILRAMARYGMILGDTGSGSWAIQAESGSTYTSFGYEDRLVAFAKQVGVPLYNGRYVFNLRDGVDWRSRLRVVHPTLESVGPSPIPPPPTTSPPPPAPGPAPPAPDAAPGTGTGAVTGGLGVGIGSVRLRGRSSVSVVVSCRRAQPGTCTGKLTITTVAKKPMRLARKSFAIPAGGRRTVTLRLSARGGSLLRRGGKLRAKVAAAVGHRKTARLVTLRAGRR